MSKLRSNAVLWVPCTGLPRKYAGRFDRARIPDLPDKGKRLHHAQLICKPFKCQLRVVFALDTDATPEADVRPVTLFTTEPEMAPERVYRIHRDRFQIEFNFRNAKQHLGLAASGPALRPATTSTSTPCSRPWLGPGKIPRSPT